jgi:methionine-R-sulfoxide reductase
MFSRLQCICPVMIELFEQEKKYKELTKEEENVIIEKGTEYPFTGKFYAFWKRGIYICKRCRAPLYRSESKFEAGCGWPSFDDEIQGSVKRIPDPDGVRTEIICAKCGAHLGHVFVREVSQKRIFNTA